MSYVVQQLIFMLSKRRCFIERKKDAKKSNKIFEYIKLLRIFLSYNQTQAKILDKIKFTFS